MPDSPTTLENIFQSVKDEVKDSRLDKLTFIRALNRLLFRMNLTKPAEQVTKMYFMKDYEKYRIPTGGFREAMAIYSDTVKIIRYVSPFRYRLKEPMTAFTDQVDNGVKYLKVRNPYTNSSLVLVSECDSLTADGTWAISGGTSLAIDETTKENGSGSISFTVNTAKCTLTFTRTNAITAAAFTEFMRERFYSWLPSLPSSIKVRVGNDSSNYYEHEITDQASAEKFVTDDVNEIEFAQEESTETKVTSIDRTNLVWFQFEFNFSAAINVDQFRIDKISIGKPEIMDIEWYTNYVAKNSSGTLIQSITEDADTSDEPIIDGHPDYINTVVDGLVYDFLKVPDPTRANIFYKRFIGETNPKGKYINGLGYLDMRYPSRRASYKRVKTLPPLNFGRVNNRRFIND